MFSHLTYTIIMLVVFGAMIRRILKLPVIDRLMIFGIVVAAVSLLWDLQKHWERSLPTLSAAAGILALVATAVLVYRHSVHTGT